MPQKTMTIGRNESCDWVVDDPYVSQVHATITERADGSLWIEDGGSINGTWVNGVKGYGPRRIYSGDQIKVGHTTLTIP